MRSASQRSIAGYRLADSMRIIYLDQNKWIQVARAVHGKKEGADVVSLVAALGRAVADARILLPLSEIHYLEIAKIRDANRRRRLGRTMWRLSKGFTLASQSTIVEYELAVALAARYPEIETGRLELIGRGIAHAFGEKLPVTFPSPFEELLEVALLTGEGPTGEQAPPFRQTKYQENFVNHLSNLSTLRQDLPASKLEDALHAIELIDILEPLNAVISRLDLPPTLLEQLDRDGLTDLVESMPTRRVDVHLHRQLLKNPQLRPKRTDLEDWSGLGKAVQYCDHVVCEKHFASLVRRDGFCPRAEIHSSLQELGPFLE